MSTDSPSDRRPERPPSAGAGKASVPVPGRSPSGAPAGGSGGSGRASVSGRATPGRAAGAAVARERRPIGSLIMVIAGALLMVAGIGIYITVETAVARVTKALPTANLLGSEGAGTSIDGVLNILMIGVDTRPDNTIGSRSDSIIILHIPASHDRGYMISIPRDTRAAIPGHGYAKINAAFQYGSAHGGGYPGGAQMLAKTLKSDYGLTFNAALIVNFSGFQDIVTALGGVTMYVDEKTTSLHHGYKIVNGKKVRAKPFTTPDSGAHWYAVPGVKPVVYTKGKHHLSAYEALDYVRIRDGLPHGDYDRERHQQQFVKAVMTEAVSKGLSNPLNAGKFLDSINKAFVWDGHGQSTADWLFTLKGISPSSLVTIKTNGGTYDTQDIGGQSFEVLSPTSLQLLQAVKSDSLDAFVAKHPSWVSTD